MAKIEDAKVKKQVQQKPLTSATKPKVEASNKDVKVFGNLSTANKSTTKPASSETLAERLSGAQGEKPKAQAKEAKREDAQASVSAFGSLTGIKSTATAPKGESIFNRLNGAQAAQAVTNPVSTNDVVSTERALAQEKTSAGSKFDSDNFAAFNDDAPVSEASVEKRAIGAGGNYGGQRVQRNEIMDLVARNQSGNTKSGFLAQRDADWKAAMGLELNTGSYGSYGNCGYGTGGVGNGYSDLQALYNAKKHKKSKGVSTGAAIAIGLGAGLGGLALGGLAGWGLTKMFSSSTEAAKAATGGVNTGNISNANETNDVAKSINSEASNCVKNGKGVISQLEKAEKSGNQDEVNAALQAGDKQYEQYDSQLNINQEATTELNNTIGQQEAEKAANTEAIAQNKTAIEKLGEKEVKWSDMKQQFEQEKDGYGTKLSTICGNEDGNGEAGQIQETKSALEDADKKISAAKAKLSSTNPNERKEAQEVIDTQTPIKNKKEQELAELKTLRDKYKTAKQKAATKAEDAGKQSQEAKLTKEEKEALKETLENENSTLASKISGNKSNIAKYTSAKKDLIKGRDNLVKARENLAKQMESTFQSANKNSLGQGLGGHYTIGNATKNANPQNTSGGGDTGSGTAKAPATGDGSGAATAKEAAKTPTFKAADGTELIEKDGTLYTKNADGTQGDPFQGMDDQGNYYNSKGKNINDEIVYEINCNAMDCSCNAEESFKMMESKYTGISSDWFEAHKSELKNA